MKISYRTHPTLEKLHNKRLGDLSHFACDKEAIALQLPFLRDHFVDVSLGINNQIYHLSDSFLGAYEKAGDKLFESDLYNQIEDDNICFITNTQTTLLKIRHDIPNKSIRIDFFDFAKEGTILSAGTMVLNYTNGVPDRDIIGFVSSNEANAHAHIFNCVLITLFIKYAEVETKILPAGQKVKGIECNYKNDTKNKIFFLNSTWFTTLIKSDGFKVRGHLRLQPYKKEGVWTKRFIWINDFEKTGYTAPARKLQEHD